MNDEPLTEWQALNVAINALHHLIYSLPPTSREKDYRAAKRILEVIQIRTARHPDKGTKPC